MFNEQREPALSLILVDAGSIGEHRRPRQRLCTAEEDAVEPPSVQLETKLQVPVLDQALLDDIEFLRKQRCREALAPDVLLAGFDEPKRELAGFESAIGGDRSFEDRAVA